MSDGLVNIDRELWGDNYFLTTPITHIMKHLFILLLASLLIASCTRDELNLDNDLTTRGNNSINGIAESFTVRIENISGDAFLPTPFAPGVWIVQKKNSVPLFMEGNPDYGDGLEAIAEDGNPGQLDASLENHPKVRSKGVFAVPVGAGGPAPIFPGDAYEFTFQARPNDHLNFATMFVQSNDLFVGPEENGIPLFRRNGDPIYGNITGYLELWDAGTEVNEEPGVGPNQAPRQSGPNTGPDENGVVQLVDDGYAYPEVSDIVRVTIYPN